MPAGIVNPVPIRADYSKGMLRYISLLLTLAVAACASGHDRSVRLLDRRLHATMASDIAAGQADLRRLPDGVRVTLLQPAMFENGVDALDGRYIDPRSSVIQGMLDPRMMRVQLDDTSVLSPVRRAVRVRNVAGYFAANGLAGVLVPPDAPPSPGPPGLVITIQIMCPHWHDGTGYGDGTAKPVCE